jgi:hypothetical protein
MKFRFDSRATRFHPRGSPRCERDQQMCARAIQNKSALLSEVSVLAVIRFCSLRRQKSFVSQLTRMSFTKYFLLLYSNCAMLLKIFCVNESKNLANGAGFAQKIGF